MNFVNKLKTLSSITLDFLKADGNIFLIIKSLCDAGGQVLLVGGAVRDLLLGLELKDLDIEIHRLEMVTVQKILSRFGYVRLVGKQFGVFKIDGINADWSLPRTDTAGRKPIVTVDPMLSYEDAFGRRDLTINAMGIDLMTGELIDPYGGQEDLKRGILKAPRAEFFIQDPLRFYRVIQFIGRFDMFVDPEFEQLLKTMSLDGVSQERIVGEYEKLLLLSERPSLGLRWVEKIGRLSEILPELARTKGVVQRPDFHPEGDVFEHTMQALDAMAEIVRRENLEKKDALLLLVAIVCHDLGKVTATKFIDGQWRSWGHEIEGVKPAMELTARLTTIEYMKKAVGKLVRYHMMPGPLITQGAKDPAFKRLAVSISPEVTPYLLGLLCQADKRGRNGESHIPLKMPMGDAQLAFMDKIKELNLLDGPEEPILQGADLLDVCKPGPALGKLLKEAYTIQIENGIRDKQELKKRIVSHM